MAQPPYGQQPPEYPPSGQPSYGQSPYGQPPYGQPQQYPPSQQYPPYDQPPYGNGGTGGQYGGPGGQYGGGPGGQYPPPYGYPPYGPQKQGNGFAVAGIILAFLLAPLGLIFAIVGLVKSGARNGAGKVLSIVAIVVSLIVGVPLTVGIVVGVVIAAHPTVIDPGCISAESSARALDSTINADDKAISRDENNPTAEKKDLKKFGNDIQTLITQLNAAKAEAKHQSVKDKIGQLSRDLSGALTALRAAENGDNSQANALQADAKKLQPDGTAIDQLCAPFGGTNSSGS